MADQLQTARRHTDNSRECSCSSTTLNNQLSTINFSAMTTDYSDENGLSQRLKFPRGGAELFSDSSSFLGVVVARTLCWSRGRFLQVFISAVLQMKIRDHEFSVF